MEKPLRVKHFIASTGHLVAARLLRDMTFDCDYSDVIRGHLATEVEKGFKRDITNAVCDKMLQDTDPTAGHAKNAYRYAMFILQSYLNSPVQGEDFYKIKQDLHDFSNWGKRLLQDGKETDIRKYETFSALSENLRPYQQQRERKQAEAEARRISDAQIRKLAAETTIVYDGPEGKIVMPHSADSAIHWGNQTRWCISAKTNNYFASHNDISPILICLPSPTPQEKASFPHNSSFKFAYVARTLYNEHDNMIAVPPVMLQRLVDAAIEHAGSAHASAYLSHFLSTKKRAPADIVETPEQQQRRERIAAWTEEKREAVALITRESDNVYAAYNDTSFIKKVPAHLRTDFDVCMALIDRYRMRKFPHLVPKSVLNDPAFYLHAEKYNAQIDQYVPVKLCKDRDFLMAVLPLNHRYLADAPEALRDDTALIRANLPYNDEILYEASPRLKDDPETAKLALCMFHASSRLKADRAFVFQQVEKYGRNIHYAAPALQQDRALLLLATRSMGTSIFASSEFRHLNNDYEIAMTAMLSGEACNFESLSQELSTDKTFLTEMLTRGPHLFDKQLLMHQKAITDIVGAETIARVYIQQARDWREKNPDADVTQSPMACKIHKFPQLQGDIKKIANIDLLFDLFDKIPEKPAAAARIRATAAL